MVCGEFIMREFRIRRKSGFNLFFLRYFREFNFVSFLSSVNVWIFYLLFFLREYEVVKLVLLS